MEGERGVEQAMFGIEEGNRVEDRSDMPLRHQMPRRPVVDEVAAQRVVGEVQVAVGGEDVGQ